MKNVRISALLLVLPALFNCSLLRAQMAPKPGAYDLATDKVVYTIGYAHLDTEWNWDYPTTISEYIKNIMTENFSLFEKFPNYRFNFTGSRRYQMMKEYYPDLYKKVVDYIKKGYWHVSGSSVDEGETVVSSPESLLRQVLYGNNYFRKEFGVESKDYLLPDCFGFPASLPTTLRHAGLLGFSTQKLTWGSAVGIPFNVGTWYGPDGSGLMAALNAGSYTGHVIPRFDLDESWSKRLDENKAKTGYAFDFRYYGVGDEGGAPRENDVKHVEGSLNNPDSKFKILLTSSDQIFKDITPDIQKQLPTYTGELLLTEHSAGSITSQAFMKKMNRKNELLAKATEQLASIADWKGAASYPFKKLNDAWDLVLGSQFHDILPGTSIPKAYEYAWNDEYIAANGFANVLKNSVSSLAKDLDTRVSGKAIVVYNPVAIEREDIVTAELLFEQVPEAITVLGPNGKPVPCQILEKNDRRVKFIFLAKVPSVGLAVYDVRAGQAGANTASALKVTDHSLENAYYKVDINAEGNIASIYDKINKRELLNKPATLDFQSERSYEWPAWNMDWSERQKPPVDYLNKGTSMRIVENGPLRVAIEVKRKGLNSEIAQVLSLSAGQAGKQLVIDNLVDWQSKGVSLKAAFPLTAANDLATYDMGVGAIERGVNNPKAYEAPVHKWFDQTDRSKQFGVSIIEDCKYGTDKPDANTLRLTLLFTPQPDKRYVVQGSQDWGMHSFKYGVYAHSGDWRKALTPWQGEFLNQPLLAFEADQHPGKDGRSISFLHLSSPQIGLMAFKKMENSEYYIVRVNELLGKDAKGVNIVFPAKIVDAYEVNGQEQRIGEAGFGAKNIKCDIGHYAIRSFAVKFAPVPVNETIKQEAVALPYNLDAFSSDGNRHDGSLEGRYSIPADLIPDEIISEDIRFKMGSRADENNNAVMCKGQKIDLPQGDYNAVYILAVADADMVGKFSIDDTTVSLPIQDWSNYIGQYYNRRFQQDEITVKSMDAPYVKNGNIAWFASHRHQAYPSKDNPYSYSYIFKYRIKLPRNAKSITLPNATQIKVFAITVAKDWAGDAVPLQPLYDDLNYGKKVTIR